METQFLACYESEERCYSEIASSVKHSAFLSASLRIKRNAAGSFAVRETAEWWTAGSFQLPFKKLNENINFTALGIVG